jgi:DNA repair protein RadC
MYKKERALYKAKPEGFDAEFTIAQLQKEVARKGYVQRNALYALSRFESIEELTRASESELLSVKGFGRRTLRHVRDCLAKHDLKLAPDPPAPIRTWARVDERLDNIESQLARLIRMLNKEKTND